MHKNMLFLLKNCKNGPALGVPFPNPQLRNPGYTAYTHVLLLPIHLMIFAFWS